jgi:hypothetical protein
VPTAYRRSSRGAQKLAKTELSAHVNLALRLGLAHQPTGLPSRIVGGHREPSLNRKPAPARRSAAPPDDAPQSGTHREERWVFLVVSKTCARSTGLRSRLRDPKQPRKILSSNRHINRRLPRHHDLPPTHYKSATRVQAIIDRVNPSQMIRLSNRWESGLAAKLSKFGTSRVHNRGLWSSRSPPKRCFRSISPKAANHRASGCSSRGEASPR